MLPPFFKMLIKLIASYDTFNKGFRWNESDKNYIMTLTKVIASVL